MSVFKKNIEEIIRNQSTFKNEILSYFKHDMNEMKTLLKHIKSKDDFINKELNKIKTKFKKAKFKNTIDSLFFMHPKRNENYFVWWDSENEEAIILKYEK